MLDISSFYTSAPKTTIIWDTVPEILGDTDRNFCLFGPFFCPFTRLTTQKIKILKKWKKIIWRCHHYDHLIYAYWDMKWDRHITQNVLSFWSTFALLPHYWSRKLKFRKNVKKLEILSSCTRVPCHFGPFLPSDPPNNLENQNFEKMKNMPGDIIILHLCTTNDNHMMYGSWDMERNRQNFLSIWTIFYPFTTLPPPPTIRKIIILRKWKNAWRYYPFTHVYYKWRSYDLWFLG